MLHEHVELLEAAFVQQHVDPFAGGEFAFGVLPVDALLSATECGFFAPFDQLTDLFLNITHTNLSCFD